MPPYAHEENEKENAKRRENTKSLLTHLPLPMTTVPYDVVNDDIERRSNRQW